MVAPASVASDAAYCRAREEAREKSTGQRMWGYDGVREAASSARGGTVRTGHPALRSTFSVTDPRQEPVKTRAAVRP